LETIKIYGFAYLIIIIYFTLVINHGKNIILMFFIAIYFIAAFSGTSGTSGIQKNFAQATNHCFIGIATRTEPIPQPRWEPLKSRPSVLKVEIQTGTIVPPHLFPSIQNFSLVGSPDPNRLHPHISYVRYLPRDPPIA